MGRSARTSPVKPEDKIPQALPTGQLPETPPAGKAVETREPEGQPPAPTQPEALPRFRVTAPGGLNLRVGPARDFPVRCVLAPGAELEELPGAEVPGWKAVAAGTLRGWVAAAYLAPAEV